MPVKLSYNDIPRIKYNNQTIRRAYRNGELVYGLYDVHYYDRDNIDTYSQKQYAGGYKPEAVEFPLPTDAPEYFNEYITHYGESTGTYGGYDENTLSNRKDKIDIDDHKDLNMYARGRQHRYAYIGKVAYDVYRYIEPEPGGMPTPSSDAYPGSGSAAYAAPNCTGYAYYRVQEMGYSQPLVGGYPDAGQSWLDNVNTGGGGSSISGTSNGKTGDILVGDGHVAVVESDGEVSESVGTEYLYSGTALPRSGTAEELYDFVIDHFDEEAKSMSGGHGGTLGSRYGSKQSGGSRGFSGNGIGILRYTG